MKKLIPIALLLIFGIACDHAPDENGPVDLTSVLENWADNIIIPSYVNYNSKLQTLADRAAAFNENPTTTNLALLRNSWLDGYKAYQYVSMYDLGVAKTSELKLLANTFPTDATEIENNIAYKNYVLEKPSQYKKGGFPALDYMINGLGESDEEIVSFYATYSNSNLYKSYLTVLIDVLKSNASAIQAHWKTTFRKSFVESNDNSANSSFATTVNEFVKHLEKDIRTNKIGIAAGKFSEGQIFPEKVEAFYKKDVSKELLLTAIQAQQDFFNGKHFNSTNTGPSLKSHLETLGAFRQDKKLSEIINSQFEEIKRSLNTLDNNFSEIIKNKNSKILATYDVIQQNVVYTKLDMMQALNISITYIDSDGD